MSYLNLFRMPVALVGVLLCTRDKKLFPRGTQTQDLFLSLKKILLFFMKKDLINGENNFWSFVYSIVFFFKLIRNMPESLGPELTHQIREVSHDPVQQLRMSHGSLTSG